MKKLRTILEGEVVKFPTAIAKRKKRTLGNAKIISLKGETPKSHQELLERQALGEKGKHKNVGYAIDGVKPLLNHIRDEHGLIVMRDGLHKHPDDFIHGVVELSKGIRIAKDAGVNWPKHSTHGVYFNQKYNVGFEDGYGGEVGLAIKKNATGEEIGEFLKSHMPKHVKEIWPAWKGD